MGDTLAPDPEEAAESDLVVLWGIDAVATNLHFVARARAARARGGRVLLVDTYRTPTAAVADRTFLVRPGSDAALALGILHVLARDGRVDRAFVAAHVQGFDALEREVLPAWTPAAAAAATGLAAPEIEELAAALGAARAAFLRIGSGLSRYANGAATVRAILAIPAALGSWARRGGGALCSTSAAQAFDLSPVTREDLLARPARTVNMNLLGNALGELHGPRVMSLYVYHANPAAVAPDQNAVLAGLAREDLFTVVHERFLTDTARFADVVLPATSSLEQSDSPQVVRSVRHPAHAPRHPAARRGPLELGHLPDPGGCHGARRSRFPADGDDLVDALLARGAPLREGLDRAAIDEGRPVKLRLPEGAKARFRTPSGKIELLNPRLAEPLPRALPTHVDARGEAAAPGALRLLTAPSVWGLNSSFLQERDDLRGRAGRMQLRMSPSDALSRGVADGDLVRASNARGEVLFHAQVTGDVPAGVVVAPGVRRLKDAEGGRTVNALTAQRLTDQAGGSTFYDTAVVVERVGPTARDRGVRPPG